MKTSHIKSTTYALAISFILTTATATLPPSTDYPLSSDNNQETLRFDGWSISEQLFKYIRMILPEGCSILELGSGEGTKELAQHYTMISIEHDKKFLSLYPSTYIYAPIVNGWYDTRILEQYLKNVSYDLILVDGPTGAIGRGKFLDNLHLFNTAVPIIFDDTNRAPEYELCVNTARALGRPFQIITSNSRKSFGVIPAQAPQQ